jgi:cell division protein FtsB
MKPEQTEEELRAEIAGKVLQLTIELAETRQAKKDSNAAYNDEIKRLNAEIKELITEPEVKEGAK